MGSGIALRIDCLPLMATRRPRHLSPRRKARGLVTALIGRFPRGCSRRSQADGEVWLEVGGAISRPDRGSVTAEVGNSTVGHLEGAASARVTACPYLQGVASWLERRLDCVVELEGADGLAIDRDLEYAAPELNAGGFPRQPDFADTMLPSSGVLS